MPLLAGITFRKIGKLHYYAPEALTLAVGDHVLAETEKGVDLGEVKVLREVAGTPKDLETTYRLLSIATDTDQETLKGRLTQAESGLKLCQEKADHLHLSMKVVDSEVAFDGQQITFYFVAESRIDFRQLVKEVAAQLRQRVHLHQVGTRDHAKALGGYGPCGRPLCCTTFLRDFVPVSMKMAKDQSLFLNPSKFSGVCGKLMCCLRYEHDVYMEAKERLPSVGMTVFVPTGEKGVITEVNIFRESVTVMIRSEDITRPITVPARSVNVARACGDCGSAGGGCGSGSCGTDSGCAPAKATPQLLQLERRRIITAKTGTELREC